MDVSSYRLGRSSPDSFKILVLRRYRLARSRTSGSQPENPGSNPGSGTKILEWINGL